jgi:OmpA-OmpF porin, OOP family
MRLVLALALTAVPSIAFAQGRTGFAVDRFEPAERGSQFFVNDTLDLRGSGRPAFGAVFDYAYKPLVFYDRAGNERSAIVRHQLFTHVGGALTLADFVRIGLNVPIAMYQDGETTIANGETLRGADKPAIGDVRLAADVALLGKYGDAFVLAAGIRGWLPTGQRAQFTGDGSFRFAPQAMVAGDVRALTYAARLAVQYRGRDDAYAGSSLGSELVGSIGAGVKTPDGRLVVGPEIWASSVLTDGDAFLKTRGTPVEGVFGGHYALDDLQFGAGVGTGLTRGYGSPEVRALFSVEYAPRYEAPKPAPVVPVTPPSPPPEPIPEKVVEPPPPPPPPEPVDTDGDGIVDSEDACPKLAGPRDPDPKKNGCPLVYVTEKEVKINDQIKFKFDSAEILQESDTLLGAIKKVIDEHPELTKIRIEGHTDNVGKPDYNKKLSERRAEAVRTWLVSKGVKKERLMARGFGQEEPIDSNETDAGRANNRRVAFTILERDETLKPKP